MLQFITHPSDSMTIIDEIRSVVAGGCGWVQLRMKDASPEEIIAVAKEAKKICKEADCILIIDDYPDIAKELELDGVHLGKNDMPIDEARKILGSDKIIGGTANTFEDVERLYRQGADYIGCGPFRFTTTKKNLSPVLGLEGYQHIVDQMKSHGINLPIVAIGGILESDIKSILATGVSGIAVSGGILNAENPAEEMQRFLKHL